MSDHPLTREVSMFARVMLCHVVLCSLAVAPRAQEPKEEEVTKLMSDFSRRIHQGAAQEPKEEKVSKLKPTLVFSGSHSQIRRERFEVVSTEAGWKDVWQSHRGKEHDPPFTESWQELNIDFDTHYVICLFTGWHSGLDVTTFAKDNAVLVRFAAHGYQTEGTWPGGKDPRTEHQKAKEAARADYCFVVLPKPVKLVVIEQDTRRRFDAPPLWTERTRFPIQKDKK